MLVFFIFFFWTLNLVCILNEFYHQLLKFIWGFFLFWWEFLVFGALFEDFWYFLADVYFYVAIMVFVAIVLVGILVCIWCIVLNQFQKVPHGPILMNSTGGIHGGWVERGVAAWSQSQPWLFSSPLSARPVSDLGIRSFGISGPEV